MLEITEGSMAVAEAVRLCRRRLSAAYPITPQTHIVEALAEMVANGRLDADYITVESEFSALSACLGASAAGPRTYSATTSQGLALMFEVCFNVAGHAPAHYHDDCQPCTRAHRSPSGTTSRTRSPCGIPGWLQFYAEDNQEATDLHYIAYRVAENPAVHSPRLSALTGSSSPILMSRWTCSRRRMPTSISRSLRPQERLDAADPISFGMYATPEYYLEFRYETDKALKEAKSAIHAGRKRVRATFRPRLQRDGRGIQD